MSLFACAVAAVALFNGKDLSGWYTHINGKGTGCDPDKVFTVTDEGHLLVSGNGYGYIATDREYENYRLTLEYRWCGRGYGYREHKTADSGILFHAFGEDGGIGDTWMRSFECNILVGRVGSLFVVGVQGEDALKCRTRVDGEGRWDPAGRDVAFVDSGTVGNRFDTDRLPSGSTETVPPERPYGEWNSIELVCRGATAAYYHNGVLVNELWDMHPTKGKILLQTEGHGIEYRNVRLEQLPVAEPSGVPSPVPSPWMLAADERLRRGLSFASPAPGRSDGRVYYYVPEGVDLSKPTGLFVFLHGGDGTAAETEPEKYLLRIDGQLRPHIDELGFVVAALSAPNAADRHLWNGPGAAAGVCAAIEDAAKRFNLDRDRIVLGGHSMGACGVYPIGAQLADRLAGVWISAGAWRWMDFRAFYGTPVYLQQGKWDCAAAYRQDGETPRGNMWTGPAFAIAADELMTRDGVEHVFDFHEGGHGLGWEPTQRATRRFVAWARDLRRDPFAPRAAVCSPVCTGLTKTSEACLRSRWLEVVATTAGKVEVDENWPQGPMYAWTLRQLEAQEKRPVLFKTARDGVRLVAENCGGNRFKVEAENVTAFRVYLSPQMGDLAKPFTLDVGKLGIRTLRAKPVADSEYRAVLDVTLGGR